MKRLALVLLLLAVLVLPGCTKKTPKPPNEEQIQKELSVRLPNLQVDDSVFELSHISNIEIEKRQTNEKDDLVYFFFTASYGQYSLTGGYAYYYVYYDEGGWILEETQEYGEIKIISEGEEPPLYVDLSQSIRWRVGQIASGASVTEINHEKVNETCFVYYYDYEENREYQNKTGKLIVTYELEQDDWMEYHWEQTVDTSNIVATWDLVGDWHGEIEGWSAYDYILDITIDSYNSENGALHISKVVREDIDSWRIGNMIHERTDFTVYPTSKSTATELIYEFYLDEKYGRYNVGFRFKPDSAKWHATYLQLFPLQRISGDNGIQGENSAQEDDSVQEENSAQEDSNVQEDNSAQEANSVQDNHASSTPVAYLSQLDYFNKSSTWFFDEISKDNLGNEHLHSFRNPSNSSYGISNGSVTYKLNGEYSRLTGVYYQEYNARAYNGKPTIVVISGDGQELWRGSVTSGVEPIAFDIDITGVLELTLEYPKSGNGSASWTRLGDVALWA